MCPPESFVVVQDIPSVYYFSVTSNMVKSLLLRIGIFAIDGIIFRIHGDRSAAISAISPLLAIIGAGDGSNFEMWDQSQAQQPNTRPVTMLAISFVVQLDSKPLGMPACHNTDDLGDHGAKSPVKNALSANTLNGQPDCSPTATATSRLPPTSQAYCLTGNCDKHAYSSWIITAGDRVNCHRNATSVARQTRTHLTGIVTVSAGKTDRPDVRRSPIFLKVKGNTVVKKCFKFLASDHFVSQCRDPIKCSRCLHLGHKSFQCKTFPPYSMSTRSDDSFHSTGVHPASPTIASMIADAVDILHSHVPGHGARPAPPPTPGAGSSCSVPAKRTMVEAHIGDGEYEASKVFAYVYLGEAVHSTHIFIPQAMEAACGALAFHLAASARGVGTMVFDTPEERD